MASMVGGAASVDYNGSVLLRACCTACVTCNLAVSLMLPLNIVLCCTIHMNSSIEPG